MSMNTITDKLSLHFQPEAKGKTFPLSQQVQQIIAERGAFRDISAKALQDEIRRPSESAKAEDTNDFSEDDSSDEDDPQARKEKLWKTRAEMLQKLSYAQNEILSALDFVSLLLSSHTPAATSTMSPTLKELVPPKTLDGRITKHNILPTARREQLQAVSDGWKLESFHKASTKFYSASTQLTRQAERQSKYWEQIAEIQSKGWLVSRFPTDSRAIGVHFGLQESSAQFRVKGFAPIHQDDEGNLHLGSKLLSSKAKVLTLAIVRYSKETGTYHFPFVSQSSPPDIESELIKARDALFYEELFFEVGREARLIANQGVRSQPQAIEADIGNGLSIKLTQSDTDSIQRADSEQQDDGLAKSIAYCLRYLLLSEHQRLHSIRTRPPPPMSLASAGPVEYAIIRPVLAQLRHEQHKISTAELCKSYIPSFQSAGIPFAVEMFSDAARKLSNTREDFNLFRSHMVSSIDLTMANLNKVTISLDTYLGSPLYGTSYRVGAVDLGFVTLKEEQLDSIDELSASIANLCQLMLVNHVKCFTAESKGTQVGEWKLIQPHSGEFLIGKGGENSAKAVVSIRSRCIILQYALAGVKSNANASKKAFLWKQDGRWSSPAGDQNRSDNESLEGTIIEANKAFQI